MNAITNPSATTNLSDVLDVNVNPVGESFEITSAAPPIAFPTATSVAEKNAHTAPSLVKSIANSDTGAAKAAVLNAQQLAQQAAQQTAQKLSSAASLIAQSIGSGSEQMHLAQKAALAECRARVRQRPVTSLLIAAAFGYAFCLLRRATK